MNRFIQKLATAGAIAAAAVGTAILPATQAHADDPLPCPRIFGVACTWTEPDGQGQLRLLFNNEVYLSPGVWSTQIQDAAPWCFYADPGFNGRRLQLQPSETKRDLGFEAHSARRGFCDYE